MSASDPQPGPNPGPSPGSGAMFDRIAGRYDRLNRILSLGGDRRWRRATARALRPTPGQRVLDLACGTADMTLVFDQQHPGVAVVGLDPSTRMLEVGRGKLALAGVAGAGLVTGDAQRLPFGDDLFDGVTMAFGIRNVPDRPQALREMARVTRPGGGVAILELSEPQGGALAPLARLYIRRLVPRIGAWLSGEREYRYLQTSIAAFPPPEAFAELMEQAGIAVQTTRPLTFGACVLYHGVVR